MDDSISRSTSVALVTVHKIPSAEKSLKSSQMAAAALLLDVSRGKPFGEPSPDVLNLQPFPDR